MYEADVDGSLATPFPASGIEPTLPPTFGRLTKQELLDGEVALVDQVSLGITAELEAKESV
jgi:hypothetical protein